MTHDWFVLRVKEDSPHSRCVVCQHHEYLIKENVGGYWYVHTQIDKPLGQFTANDLIHYWKPNGVQPTCLYAYATLLHIKNNKE